MSVNKYKNHPFPRPLTQGAVKSWKPWNPNPNPSAVRTLTRTAVVERHNARRTRSTKRRKGDMR